MNFGNTVFWLASLKTCVLITCLKHGGSEIARMILSFNWFSYLTWLNCWMYHTHLLFRPSHFGTKANKIHEPCDFSKSWLPIHASLTLWDQYYPPQPSLKMCWSASSLTAQLSNSFSTWNLPVFSKRSFSTMCIFWSIQSSKSSSQFNSKVYFAEPTLFKKITCHTYTQEWFFIAKGMFFFVDL